MRKQADQIRLEETGEKKKGDYIEEVKSLLVAIIQMAIEDHLRCKEGTHERTTADNFLRSDDFVYMIRYIYDDEVDPESIREMLFSGKLTWEKYHENKTRRVVKDVHRA